MTDVHALLQFWFGEPAEDDATLRAKLRRWFAGGSSMDRVIRERFGFLVEQALSGLLDHWSGTPPGRLALILLCDQATRSVHRGTPRAFDGDARALRLALAALNAGLDGDYSIEERIFLHSPLVHAEDRGMLSWAVALSERLVQEAPPGLRPALAIGLGRVRRYEAVIYRFGRFPHRNAILGRKSTPEEKAFLAEAAALAPAGL